VYAREVRTTRGVRPSTPHKPKGASLTRQETAQPQGCDKENCAKRRVQTTTRRAAPHRHKLEPHNPKGASLSAPLGSGRARRGAARPGGCVAPLVWQCDTCAGRSRTTRRVRRSRGGRRVACARNSPHSPRVAAKETPQQQGGKEPHAALHRAATSAGRTTQRVRRPVCPSVRGSRTTRRVRRSSDNWGDTPGVMPHNPEGASLHPIDGVARAPARTALPERCVKPETRDGAHNRNRAQDRGARLKGCFTHKPDARHQSEWALKKTGRTTRRVQQPQKTGRRARPTARARQGSTTQWVLHPENPTRGPRASGR